jgi:hypothetical protein
MKLRLADVTWPVAAGAMVLGFAVADATGVRPLGGLVLLAAAAWCARRWLARVGAAPAVALLAFWLALFVTSHVLAEATGTWPAVLLVAAALGVAAWAVADSPRRPPPRTRSRDRRPRAGAGSTPTG